MQASTVLTASRAASPDALALHRATTTLLRRLCDADPAETALRGAVLFDGENVVALVSGCATAARDAAAQLAAAGLRTLTEVSPPVALQRAWCAGYVEPDVLACFSDSEPGVESATLVALFVTLLAGSESA